MHSTGQLTSFKEGISHEIDLKEDEPQVIQQMLIYFYSCYYDDEVPTSACLSFNAKMYAVADKYDISLLKKTAQEKFARAMKDYDWADPADFLSATEVTYSTTLSSDKGLRDLIMSAIKEKQQQLRGNEGYRTLIKTKLANGDFALDVVDALTE